MRAKALVVALCVMLGVAMAAPASAAFTYYTCTISAAGVTGAGSPYIIVTDTAGAPAFTNWTFIIQNNVGQANACLAAALTAWSTGGKVIILLNAPAANFDPVWSIACSN